jgi:glutamate dehydrogenase/leucine dehydrogenase
MELTAGANDHEQVVFCQDRAAGLRAIIAVHNTALGPGMGGTRFYPFETEQAALQDVLRLSRAMTYKSAAAGLPFGGGKAVIIGDPRRDRTEELFRAYAGFVDSLGGRYITTEDVGTTEADMLVVATRTKFVTGLPDGSGDTTEATAGGESSAMRTIARRLWSADSLAGRHVAIQGVGKVGSGIARHLAQDGCRLTIADVAADTVERLAAELNAAVVPADRAHAVECDIFSPCALGGALSPETIPALRCEAVLGCANNQLASPQCADMLASRGITYAPDYIVNAGGVINIAHEVGGYDRDAAFAHAWRIGETLEHVLDLAGAEGITTARAADILAENRFKGDGS